MTSEYRTAVQGAVDALASGRVVAQRWSDGALTFYPRGSRASAAAGSPAPEEIRTATVIASTTVREHSHPEFQAEVPFTLLIVDCDGARVMCRLAPGLPAPAPGTGVSLRVSDTPRGPIVTAS